MNQAAKLPMTFDDERSENGMNSLNNAEEFEWLMSLALDDVLDEQEAERFEMLLNEDVANLDRWAGWQAIDNGFHDLPVAVPVGDFCEKFALRLEIQERRRRLRTGVIFGVAAIALWISALSGIILLGALAWSNQGEWLGAMIHNLAYWWSAVQQFGRALVNTIEALLSAPQTRAIALGYVVVVAAILTGWFFVLRRSTRELPLAEVQLVEA